MLAGHTRNLHTPRSWRLCPHPASQSVSDRQSRPGAVVYATKHVCTFTSGRRSQKAGSASAAPARLLVCSQPGWPSADLFLLLGVRMAWTPATFSAGTRLGCPALPD
jgi:hypothetical protein